MILLGLLLFIAWLFFCKWAVEAVFRLMRWLSDKPS